MDQVRAAARLFRDFSGHRADRVTRVRAHQHGTQLLVGEVEGIAYNTVRDGKREHYVHEFRPESRPFLSAAHDGSRLYLLDGAYRFTHRGIVDRSRSNMAAEIALVSNPKGRKMRRHRTAAQKAATRKMLAARWGRKVAKHAKINPSHRKAHGKKSHHRARHHSVMRAFRGHRSINPVRSGFVMGELLPTAAGGVVAGLGVNLAIGFLPLPPVLKVGIGRNVLALAGAVGVGFLAGKMFGKRIGEEIAAGGVAVTLYDMVKGFVVQKFPSVPLVPAAVVSVPTATLAPAGAAPGGVQGWTSPAVQFSDAGAYVDGVGAYVDGMGADPVYAKALAF